jgi:hypothetical protein
MTLVTYRRLADAPPPERELLAVEADGRASVWRSNGTAIGRFGGIVADLEGLRAAVVGAAAGAPPTVATLPPGAALEVVEAGGRTARVEARAPVNGPWSRLVEHCRRELDAQVDAPLAAIAGALGVDGVFRLEHRGSAPLPVELASLMLELVLWRDGSEAGRGRVTADGLGRVEAGPGWSLVLPAPEADLSGRGTLVAVASFVADDAGIYVPVAISASVTI